MKKYGYGKVGGSSSSSSVVGTAVFDGGKGGAGSPGAARRLPQASLLNSQTVNKLEFKGTNGDAHPH
jgi:hypothetical protein